MTGTVELVVLGYTRFGENRLVVHTLSREYGRRSFLTRVGKGGGMSLYLPLNILEATVTENPKSSLWNIGKVSARFPLFGIRDNLYKNTITLSSCLIVEFQCMTARCCWSIGVGQSNYTAGTDGL